ncbi:AbrB/MazE/SpoVT family DNA-binding domain-containing protein [Terriglobus saanensis]|uniref:Addiction module antidote n=1 Tax=Terriglobus saanensis (strain ATCC BAA-1853 / DSM 23119 / SP1PR4) TaxID=401053 RepID=E8V2Y2_TERSS|nr:AbrB/MazE/SpoVT family DNA-binding domain-containing protein [Terriglobus saanensis]ADV84679.1 addiction module antidote [Terriglobus saanensis SP1PR4]
MGMTLRIITVGNSAGVVLPKELMAKFNLEKGDELYVTETPEGLHLSPHQPDFAAKMDVARRVMRENRDVLRKLAE